MSGAEEMAASPASGAGEEEEEEEDEEMEMEMEVKEEVQAELADDLASEVQLLQRFLNQMEDYTPAVCGFRVSLKM